MTDSPALSISWELTEAAWAEAAAARYDEEAGDDPFYWAPMDGVFDVRVRDTVVLHSDPASVTHAAARGMKRGLGRCDLGPGFDLPVFLGSESLGFACGAAGVPWGIISAYSSYSSPPRWSGRCIYIGIGFGQVAKWENC